LRNIDYKGETIWKGWKIQDITRRHFIINPDTEGKLGARGKMVQIVLSLGTGPSSLILGNV
jgi:hypothetical protein